MAEARKTHTWDALRVKKRSQDQIKESHQASQGLTLIRAITGNPCTFLVQDCTQRRQSFLTLE
jgi:hypothetical protein